jgi:hypothetical protein
LPDQSSKPGSGGEPRSSRTSPRGAGFECEPAKFKDRKSPPFYWLSPLPLWESRNDRLIRWFKEDPTNDRRRAWMQSLGVADSDLRIDYSGEDSISFLVMGDTGEGDHSQEAVAGALQKQVSGASFAFICSDVIYPAGGIGEYEEKFFEMYESLELPIYAVPGNHDWYDDGVGFMRWICGATTRPPETKGKSGRWALLRRLLWRRPPKPWPEDSPQVAPRFDLPESRRQRSPYFCIDAGPVRLVGIDTGISGIDGELDADQARWLEAVSAGPKPKILLTGKPLYVDGEHHPGSIEGSTKTVDQIVKASGNNYIAAIGGDIHNYQRYPVTVDDGRTLMYVVSGGGGAFMHETHSIENLDRAKEPLRGTSEGKLRLYPRRGDCLARYSDLYGRKFRFLGLRSFFDIPPFAAEKLVAKRYSLPVTRPEAKKAKVTWRMRLAKSILFALPGRGRKGLHVPFAEWLDWDEPPFFKHFLRIDATDGEVRIRCFAATGCEADEHSLAIEDELLAREEKGEWKWQYPSGGAATL